jgi:hypothetical protein
MGWVHFHWGEVRVVCLGLVGFCHEVVAMAENVTKRAKKRERDDGLMRTVSLHHFHHAGNPHRLTISCSEVSALVPASCTPASEGFWHLEFQNVFLFESNAGDARGVRALRVAMQHCVGRVRLAEPSPICRC